jgi:photosystem II stability/assembly factor-like uncharacterized protein
MWTLAVSLLCILFFAGVSHAAQAPEAATPKGVWIPVPLITAELRAQGVHPGGEGGQWVRTIATDSADGSFVLYGTDVGGLFRSLDGGATWEPANVGFRPRGASGGAAIDPHNPNRALLIAGNSVVSDFHGVWLTHDKAASWKQVYEAQDCGSQDFRDQLAFDPSTYDATLNLTTDVYWSRVAIDKAGWGETKPQPALYKSTDGGQSWTRLPDTAHLGGGYVRVHPTARGVVYVATPKALYRSNDAAATFTKLHDGNYTGMDISRGAPDRLVLSTPDRLLISNDRGTTINPLTPVTPPGLAEKGFTLRGVRISPADADRLMLFRQQDDGWDWTWHASHDGGKTWTRSDFDNRQAFLPYNVRNGVWAFHPKDPLKIVGTGADWPTRSDDGGKTFRWSANGFNVVLIGGTFHFSLTDPNVLFFGSQDYNGAVTDDRGHTWRYVNPAGESWGGFTYGGYAANRDLLFVAKALGWGGTKSLRISRDGGRNWTPNENIRYTNKEGGDGDVPFGLQSALADPSDPQRRLYFGPWRSSDAGETWTRMSGCDGVLLAGRDRDETYAIGLDIDHAAKRSRIVESRDAGATWRVLATVQAIASDVAIDRSRNRLYVVGDDHLLAVDLQTGNTESLPTLPDEWGGRRVRSVALDPVDPSLVYAAQTRDVHIAANGVMVSRDAGETWQCLNLSEPLRPGITDGGREPFWLRVHPVTRDLWVAGGCFGVWRINVTR